MFLYKKSARTKSKKSKDKKEHKFVQIVLFAT